MLKVLKELSDKENKKGTFASVSQLVSQLRCDGGSMVDPRIAEQLNKETFVYTVFPSFFRLVRLIIHPLTTPDHMVA